MAVTEKRINSENGLQTNVLELENDHIKVAVLPEIGGKMISLESKKTGINYLLESNKKYPLPAFKDSFGSKYAYGFDECFPTVEPCSFKSRNEIISLPDHGEVWSRSWNYICKRDSIILSIQGIKLNYSFEKEITLSDASLVITYTLENKSHFAFDYIWSSHPLLAVQQGDGILLNKEIKELLINWSSEPDLGAFGDCIRWPEGDLTHKKIDWSIVQERATNIAVKLFSDRLTQGRAAIYKKDINESLLLRFDADKIPYLGLWLCYGGWPGNSDQRSYTVALEPASARPDALTKALERDEASMIKAQATKQWELEFCLSDGRTSI